MTEESTSVELVSLLLLAQAVATATLSLAILWLYRRSSALPHVWPLAVSYLWLLGIAITRASLQQVVVPWVQWNCVGAFLVGDVGLLILLSRTWPRNRNL